MRERHISHLWADEGLNQVCWDDIGSRRATDSTRWPLASGKNRGAARSGPYYSETQSDVVVHQVKTVLYGAEKIVLRLIRRLSGANYVQDEPSIWSSWPLYVPTFELW
jgi:hypothetical protein